MTEFNGQLDDYLLRDSPDEHQPDDDEPDYEPDYESIAADREAARWE